jgi:hypothetical protein
MMLTLFLPLFDSNRLLAPTQNCIVTDRDGHDHEAKVVHAFQARIPLVGDLVYAYYLETPYGRPLGHFRPSQLRCPEVVVIGDEAPGEAPGATDGNGSVEGEGSGHDSDEDLDDESGGSDDNDGHNADDSIDQGNADSSDDNDGHGGDQGNADDSNDQGNADKGNSGPAQQAVHRGRGRKPKSDNDVDATNWCHETELTFLKTVVAHNPFAKMGCSKIGDKWQDIALDLAAATRHMGVHAVTARPDALRVKFTRLKLRLKNFRQNGKGARQSGVASVQARNAEYSKQAESMDECLNLQRDVAHTKSTKKKCDEAAKKRKATLRSSWFCLLVTHTSNRSTRHS